MILVRKPHRAHTIFQVACRSVSTLEIGPNDLAKQQTLSVRRDTGAKVPIALADLKSTIPQLLETIRGDMYKKALDEYNAQLKEVTRWEDFVQTLDNKCIPVIPWCEKEACEDEGTTRSVVSVLSRCSPVELLSVEADDQSLYSAEPQDERAPSPGAKSLAIPTTQDHSRRHVQDLPSVEVDGVSFYSAVPQDERASSAGAKSLAIPFDQARWTPIEPSKTKCVGCG